jgi:CPA1 family monovalent cation:H+ antiporter
LIQFLLNSLLFVLIGLQLPTVIDGLGSESASTLIGYAAVISAAVIVTRLLWVPVFTYLPRMLFARGRSSDPAPKRNAVALLAWTGMRGAVSLAAALALPLTVDGGGPFPHRDLIIFLTYCVILVTLVGQGLSLPALIRVLRVEEDDSERREENKARLRAAKAALRRIDELTAEESLREDTAERMRGMFEYRARRFAARFDDADDGGLDVRSELYQRAVREVIAAQRTEVVQMRNQGYINDAVMHRVERDLDLEWQRLE